MRLLSLIPLNSIRRVAEPGRRLIRRLDQFCELTWERRNFHFPSRPGTGEMTARLLRMGVPSFTEYAVGQMLGSLGPRVFIVANERRHIVETLRSTYPREVESILTVAERLLHGRFNVLGSGLVDLRRGKRGSGSRIDWRRDPISGEQFPRVFSHWRWNPAKMRTGRADIKGPWEIGRCQHFSLLGQAYWLTNDARFARCFAATVSDFLKRNPPGFGMQWACTMDVALRVVNWIVGLSFFQGAPELSIRWWRRFLRGLVEHGEFIAGNLEFGTIEKELIASNHHVANLLGLYWLGMAFPHLDAGCVWRGIAENGLEQQIIMQIRPDGGDFESSVPYQCLVMEMFLSAYALSSYHGAPFSARYRDRLSKGLEFIAALRQDNGRQPQVGDADNGRAHIFTGYGRWLQEDMDHLLAAGAHVLGCPELAASIPQDEHVETLFWGAAPKSTIHSAPADRLRIFADSGIAVLRGGGTYVMMSNGPVGTRGFGNHKHNDQLAIEWVVRGQPLAVDAGSYIYTPDPQSRNFFRSTAIHNTVMIDDQEQNTFDKARLFKMDQQGAVSLVDARTRDSAVGVIGRHTAYCRLEPPLVHSRRVLLWSDGSMLLDDLFEGATSHRLRWYFLLYPGVAANICGPRAELAGPDGSGIIEAGPALRFRCESGWYSSGYGRRTQTVALVAERDDCPSRVSLLLTPAPRSSLDLATAIALSDRFWA